MPSPLDALLDSLRAKNPSHTEGLTPFMTATLDEFKRQQKPETADPSGRKSIEFVLSQASVLPKPDKPIEQPSFRRGFLSPEADFARGLQKRGSETTFSMETLTGRPGVETPDIGPIAIPNLEQGFGDKLAEGAGEFFPEIAGGALTPLAVGAKAGIGALQGALEAGAQDIVAGRKASDVVKGVVAGGLGGAVAGRIGGKTAASAARKGLLGEAFDEVVFKDALKSGVLPFPKEDILRAADRLTRRRATAKVTGETVDDHVADVAEEILRQPELPFGQVVRGVNNKIDVIEQAGRLGKTVREVVTEGGKEQKLLPSGAIRDAVRVLPEWAERRTVGRITPGVRRSQRLLQAGDVDMNLYRSVIASGDVGAFRVAINALGLPVDEVNNIIGNVTKDMVKSGKGRILSKDKRGEFFLKKFDELTQAPDVPDVGGRANLLGGGAGDALENTKKVQSGFETPDKVVMAEAEAEVRAAQIANIAEKLGERKLTVARLKQAITSEKPFRSLPGTTQFSADTGARNILRNAGLRDAKRQTKILNALTRIERRDQQGILKTILRDGLRQAGLNKTQATEFMGRLSPEQVATEALNIRAGKTKLTRLMSDAMRENTPGLSHIKALQRAREAMERVADSRTPLSDESGFLQIGRILESSPVPVKDILNKRAVEIITKATPERGRKILGAVILNQYLFRASGRLRDLATSTAELVGSRLIRIPTKGGLAQFRGLLDKSSGASIRTAFTTAADTWRTGIVKEIREAVAKGKMVEGDVPEELLRANIDLTEFGTGLLGFLKRFPFLPTRFNAAQDDFLTTLSYTMERNYLAARKASGEGLSGTAAEKRMWELVGSNDETMTAQAWETARRVVFREKKPAPGAQTIIGVGKKFQQSEALGGLAGPLARYMVIPFLRTPAIIAGRTVEYAPPVQFIKGIWSLVNRNMGKAGREFGASAVASAGLVSSYNLAAEGRITGAGEHLGPAERDAAQRAGTWAPNAVRIGNRWVSYAGWGPVAAAFSVGANLYERNQKGDFKGPLDWAAAYPVEIGRGAINATFMPAYARIIDGISQPGRYGRTFGERIAGIFGGIGLAASVAESMDPERRFAADPISGLQAIVPGERGDLPAKAGTFGEANEKPDSFFENIWFPRTVMKSEDPLIVHLFRINALPGRPNVPSAPKKATADQKRQFKWTPEEKNSIRLIKGKLEREAIEAFMTNRGGIEAYAASGRRPELQAKQILSVRNKINGKVNKIIINMRLAGQKLNERVIRAGLGE